MSANKTCNEFQKLTTKITEEKIAKLTEKTLKEIFPKNKSVIKRISRETGFDERSVWNWYNGLYAPSLLNFIILSQKFPSLIRAYLQLCNTPEIWDIYKNYEHLLAIANNKAEIIKCEESYGDIFSKTHVTINFSITKKLPSVLNERQKWFLQQLQILNNPKLADIVSNWGVSKRTAKRDISDLKEKGLIKFNGTGKYGKYYIL